MIWNKVTEYLPKEEVIVAEYWVRSYRIILPDNVTEKYEYELNHRYFIAEAIRMKDDSGTYAWYWVGNDRSVKINPLDQWKAFDQLPEEEGTCDHTIQTYINLDQKLLSSEFK